MQEKITNTNITFGTDGWRAVISDDFTFSNVRTVAQAIADYMYKSPAKIDKPKRMVVGFDTRFMSEDYARIISQVLAANDIEVILSDCPSPTPMVSFTIKKNKLSAGIMVTASHNPPQFNGIKFKESFGGSADPKTTKEIEANLNKNIPKNIDFNEAVNKNLIKEIDLTNDWLAFMRSYLDLDILKNKRFKVIIDIMHGAGDHFLERALKGTRCSATSIHSDRNPGFGGIPPEPIEKNLKELILLTRKEKFDIGLAVDGDVDRIGAVRPDGVFINPLQIISLLLLHFVENKGMSGGVVKTISGTMLVDKICKEFGLRLYETPVGFKHIAKLMLETDILIGGEESGGIGFKNYIPERDGILSGVLLLEMMAYRKKGIIKIMDDIEKRFGKFCYKRTDLHYPDALKAALYDRLKNSPPKRLLEEDIIQMKDFDGVKFITEKDSWILFRLSGTEPILRIYAEANSESKVNKLLKLGQRLAFNKQ